MKSCVLICVTAAKSRSFSQSVTRHSRFLLTYIFPLWQAHVTALPHLMISWKSWKRKLWISFLYPNKLQFCLKLSWFDPTESGLNNLEVHIKSRYLPSIESAHFQAFSCCEPHLFPEKKRICRGNNACPDVIPKSFVILTRVTGVQVCDCLNNVQNFVLGGGHPSP